MASSHDGKLSGLMVSRNGGGFPLEVQQDGSRFNVYGFLVPKGGEHLRWKFELNGGLTVTFSAQHDNPTQWQYDRVGAIVATRAESAAEPASAAQRSPLISENFESRKIDPDIWEERVTGAVGLKVVQDRTGLRVSGGEESTGSRAYALIRARVSENLGTSAGSHPTIFCGPGRFPASKYQEIGLNFPMPASSNDVPKLMWLANYQNMEALTRQEGRGEDVWRGDADPYN